MLRYNDSTGAFLLYTEDTKRADAAGLTLSTSLRGSQGEKVFFTADASQRPVYNPYAVLEFHEQADGPALGKLAPLLKDYKESWSTGHDADYPCPQGKEFMPYQKAGIHYALGKEHCIIGDEPGLGKTIQAIGLANAMDARRILVVCPASIRLNWEREIHEWTTLVDVWSKVILTGKKLPDSKSHYHIVSYDLLRNHAMHDALRAKHWDLVVLDEIHYLKSVDALRTRAVFGGGEKKGKFYENGLNLSANRMVGLTGTPLPNRPREAYTLARGLDWGSIDWMSQDAFATRFNPPRVTLDSGASFEVRGRLPELNARLRCNMMVRRHKNGENGVLPQLPDKRYEMTYIEPNGAIKDVLAREALIDFDPHDLFNSDFTLDGTPISTLRREMGEAMVPRIVEYIRYMMDVVEHPKLLIFAHHRSVIASLQEELAKYNPVVHIGGMTTRNKENAKYQFINNPDCRQFIGQLDTMEGVDGLQHVCSDVVLGEPAWNPGRNEQVVDRAHRIGQHGNVVAHFLLVEGSFNEKVLNVVLDKAGDIHTSLDRRLI